MEDSILSIMRSELVSSHCMDDVGEDILQYIATIVIEMSVEERRSSAALFSSISPFIIDCCSSPDVDGEKVANSICKSIAISCGGSGYNKVAPQSSSSSTGVIDNDTADSMLLSAPIKIGERTGLNKQPKSTYGGAIITSNINDATSDMYDMALGSIESNHNSSLDASSMPSTQKQLRRQRKDNEKLHKMLRMEEMARLHAEKEMADARMAAIKANRAGGRQASTGVHLDRFNIPHPSGSSDLLADASLVLSSHRRYGLIGKNGAGKTTLMTYLAKYKLDGLMHLRILLVDQHVEGDQESALQWVLRADVERTSLLEDEQRLIACQHGNADVSSLPKDLQGVNLELALMECYERMEAIGVPTSEFRARKILTGLGFTDDMMQNPTAGLSGGWAMRAALAAALFVNPDLLLLDEPTNHLDLHALVWLELWLTQNYQGILLVVSHDQVFLDSICTDIIELKSQLAGQSKSCLTHYSGDYSSYTNTVEEQRVAQQRLRVAFEKERDKLKEFIARDGKKYDNPAHQSQRKMKMKQLENLVSVEAVEDDSELVMRFPKPYCSFSPDEVLISLNSVSFRWPSEAAALTSSASSSSVVAVEEEEEKGASLFERVDLCIRATSRIVILGKNGCGKTSLLNLLDGESMPTSGKVIRHLGSRVARLQQHHYKGEQLDPNLTALEHMRRLPQEETSSVGLHDPDTRQEETAQRAYLSNFGVSGVRAVLPVRYLSGGQRMRVALACVLYRRPDLLILDEPTNHLDADTVRALCEALSTYKGAIVAVSHDESFVNKLLLHAPTVLPMGSADNNHHHHHHHPTATAEGDGELWVLSKRRVQRFEGSFREYKKIITKNISSAASSARG